MALVPLEVLWCECGGNASATPHAELIHRQVERMHADATRHALWYVGVVLALYLLGLVVIIRRAGRSERQTAASAFASCCSGAASCFTSLGRAVASVGRKRPRPNPQQEHHHHHQVKPTIMLPPEPLPQMPGPVSGGLRPPPPRKGTKPPSLQVHLVVPDDDDEMEISMITSVA